MKYVLQVMLCQGSGAIVNTASVGGMRGVGNQAAYAASKVRAAFRVPLRVVA